MEALAMVIEDNNPNVLGVIIVILAVVYIVFALFEISALRKRRERLIKTRRKIVARHDLIITENERRRKLAEEMAKDSDNV